MASRAPVPTLSDGEIRRQIRRARTASERTLRQIRQATAIGDRRTASRLTERFLHSFDSRLVAAAEARMALIARVKRHAARNPGQAQQSTSVPTLSAVIALAGSIDLELSTDEVARQVDILKPNGGRRRLTILGRERLARSYLLKRLLTATAQLHPGQLATSPLGLAGAHRHIIEIISDPAIKHVATADIRAFYDCVDTTQLGRLLGVPQSTVYNNVSYQSMRIVAHSGFESSASSDNMLNEEERPGAIAGVSLLEVERRTRAYDQYNDEIDAPVNMVGLSNYVFNNHRRGITLPQGAPSSTIIGEIVVKQIFDGLPISVIPLSWIDNTNIFGRSRAEVSVAAETLRSNMLEAPTGPFRLHGESIRRVADGFEALGGWFRRQNGRVTFRPTHRNYARYQTELLRYLAVIVQTGRGVVEARAYVRSWCAAFSNWERAAAVRARGMRLIDQTVGDGEFYRRRCSPTIARYLGIERLLVMPIDLSILWSPPPVSETSCAPARAR